MQEFDYRHSFCGFANQEVHWISPLDSQERYQYHLKTQRHELERHGWIDSYFTYRFNSQGFRCREFDLTPSLMTLGCSWTMGVGLPEHQVWPYLVSQELQLSCWNLGVGGSSNDTAFRLGVYYIPRLRPKVVALLSPCPERMEIVLSEPDQLCFVSHNFSSSSVPRDLDLFYESWIRIESNAWLDQQKNILALRSICQDNDAKFVFLTVDDILLRGDLARDLAHPGVRTQKNIARRFLDLISQ
jgi:hypothetical protein